MCVKWLNFPTEDVSARIVEWLEILFCLSCRGLMVEAMLRFSLLRSNKKF